MEEFKRSKLWWSVCSFYGHKRKTTSPSVLWDCWGVFIIIILLLLLIFCVFFFFFLPLSLIYIWQEPLDTEINIQFGSFTLKTRKVQLIEQSLPVHESVDYKLLFGNVEAQCAEVCSSLLFFSSSFLLFPSSSLLLLLSLFSLFSLLFLILSFVRLHSTIIGLGIALLGDDMILKFFFSLSLPFSLFSFPLFFNDLIELLVLGCT